MLNTGPVNRRLSLPRRKHMAVPVGKQRACASPAPAADPCPPTRRRRCDKRRKKKIVDTRRRGAVVGRARDLFAVSNPAFYKTDLETTTLPRVPRYAPPPRPSVLRLGCRIVREAAARRSARRRRRAATQRPRARGRRLVSGPAPSIDHRVGTSTRRWVADRPWTVLTASTVGTLKSKPRSRLRID